MAQRSSDTLVLEKSLFWAFMCSTVSTWEYENWFCHRAISIGSGSLSESWSFVALIAIFSSSSRRSMLLKTNFD